MCRFCKQELLQLNVDNFKEIAGLGGNLSQRLISSFWIIFIVSNTVNLIVSVLDYSVASFKFQNLAFFMTQFIGFSFLTIIIKYNKNKAALKYYVNFTFITTIAVVAYSIRNPELFSVFYFLMIINLLYGDRKLHYVSSIIQVVVYLGVSYFVPILLPIATAEDSVESLMATRITIFLAVAFVSDILYSYMSNLNSQIHLKDQEMFSDTVGSLVQALEAKDFYTNGHSERVRVYAQLIYQEYKNLDIPNDLFQIGCLLHDVGKIGIPDYILNKNGSLTEDEYKEIKEHPLSSSKILENAKSIRKVVPMVVSHHERYDGKGYPFGLQGEAIPLESRILSLVDAFDAMTSQRPYRNAMPLEIACQEILNMSGSQFCPQVVDVFQNILPNIKLKFEELNNEHIVDNTKFLYQEHS